MDYKEAYDDICQKLMSAYNTTSFIEVKKAIGQIHPELRESEDERIRKVIYQLMLGMREEIFTSQDEIVTKEKVLAYLEKQKEEEGYESIPVKSTLEYKLGFADGRDYEKQKEQKPVERYLDLTELLVPQRNIGQKLVTDGWSIKDANFHSNLLYLMRENNSKEGWEGCYEWLEELPSRISLEQKPVEWSEEDDQLIGFIFDLLNSLVWRKEWAMDKKECLERLKSLRPSWKPSEK